MEKDSLVEIEKFKMWNKELNSLLASQVRLEQLKELEGDKSSKQVRVRSAIYDLLQTYCDREGVSISQFVNAAIVEKLLPEFEKMAAEVKERDDMVNKKSFTNYRDLLTEEYDINIGSVVGCGLDRLERAVSREEIDAAVAYYESIKDAMSKLTMPINQRRQAITDFIAGRQ
jgi:hypothetical protein